MFLLAGEMNAYTLRSLPPATMHSTVILQYLLCIYWLQNPCKQPNQRMLQFLIKMVQELSVAAQVLLYAENHLSPGTIQIFCTCCIVLFTDQLQENTSVHGQETFNHKIVFLIVDESVDIEPSDEKGLTSCSTLDNSETMNYPVKFEKVSLACRVERRLLGAIPISPLETYLLPSPPCVFFISPRLASILIQILLNTNLIPSGQVSESLTVSLTMLGAQQKLRGASQLSFIGQTLTFI